MNLNRFSKNSFANRGMSLESDINITNKYYLDSDIAVIYKKPTPIRITKYSYDKSKIVEAFFETQSTLDYNGIYKGKYIEFDAKETNIRTSFPLSNISMHQLKHIRRIITHKGIVFLIVSFTKLGEYYVLKGEDLINFIDSNKRKSIPYSYFSDVGYKIELKYSPRLDYLKAVDNLWEA